MDHELKQRLIGAIVITALAAIFLPMLFDDPIEESGQMVNELALPEPPVAEFSETADKLPDFNQTQIELPEQEPVIEEPEDEYIVENIDEPEPEPASVQLPPKIKQTVPDNPVPAKVLDNESGMVRWFIQLGSFSQKENAEALKAKLAEQGFPIVIENIKVLNKGRVYRLKAGPLLDKERAKTMQIKLDRLNNSKSLLISE